MQETEQFPMRINKYLAHKGLATRLGADALITAGNVFVNEQPAVLGQRVTEKDVVAIRGATKPQYQYALYYKPRGVLSHSPAEGETDIRMKLAEQYAITDLAPIGRLDKDSEGLILLSNDGRITDRLLNPDHEHVREYVVTTDKKITGSFLKKLENGVNIEGYVTKNALVTKKTDTSFTIALTEGKKHQIRRMCAALGYQVKRLKRNRIENLKLGDLKPNQMRRIKGTELATLLTSLGL